MPSLFDERVVITIVIVWSLGVSGAIFGLATETIFRFGPSPSLTIFDIVIDTWSRWAFICFYIIINQCIETYGLNTISPWLINDIQNRNLTTIKFPKVTIQIIILCWNVYLWLSYLVALRLYFTQFDFLVLLLIMDVVTSVFTTAHYLRPKRRLFFSMYE